MITLCRATDRRHVRHGEQDTWHTFHSADGPDREKMGLDALIAFDEICLSTGGKSGLRGHGAAELVTYVRAGVISQRDSSGRAALILAGEFQAMLTGPRDRHAGLSVSHTDPAHIFRILMRAPTTESSPALQQRRFTVAQRRNQLCVVASPDARQGSLRLRQDAVIYSSMLDAGDHVVHELRPGRKAWLHLVEGEATLGEIRLSQGDGIGVTDELSVSFTAQESAEILMVDM